MNKDFRFNSAPFLLMPDEKIILRASPHLIPFVIPLAAFSFFLTVFLMLVRPDLIDGSFGALFDDIFTLVLSLAALVYYLNRRFGRLYLTNRRLVKEQGIIRKRFTSIFLGHIENISFRNGVMGEIFDFGDLEIRSERIHERIVFKGMVSVKRNKRRIVREVNRVRK